MDQALSLEHLEALRQLDSCTVSNAIESFKVRLRNEGFADASIRCLFKKLSPMVGYAVTARTRNSSPPPGGHSYFDRTDWWELIHRIPAPRIFVVQDIDDKPGLGSLLGGVHTGILQALGCIGAVTNGAVRDLPSVEAAGFHLFAGNPAVSHAYAHFVDFGTEVEIGGLKIRSGDLLHGDQHGLVLVPHEIAPQIPAEAWRMKAQEQQILALCHSKDFSLDKLRAAVSEYHTLTPDTHSDQTPSDEAH